MAVPSILLTIGLTHLTASASALLGGSPAVDHRDLCSSSLDGENMHRGLYPGFLLALIATAPRSTVAAIPQPDPLWG